MICMLNCEKPCKVVKFNLNLINDLWNDTIGLRKGIQCSAILIASNHSLS